MFASKHPQLKGEEFTPPPPQHAGLAPDLPLLTDPDIVQLFVLPPSAGDPAVDGVNIGSLDFDRLAFLGSGVIQFAITTYLFDQKLSSAEADALRQALTQPQMWAQWASVYDNFVDMGHGLNDEEAENARVFSAYVGGLYKQHGISQIQPWIQALILQTQEFTSLNTPTHSPKGQLVSDEDEPMAGPSNYKASSTRLQHASTRFSAAKTPTPTPSQSRKRDRESHSDDDGWSSPIPKRSRVSSSAVGIASGPSSLKRQQASTPPVLGNITSLSSFLANAPSSSSSRRLKLAAAIMRNTSPWSQPQAQKKWVSVLNEASMVVKATLEWSTSSEGADHLKTWIAELTVPELGASAIGEGKTKKSAQEDAARQVCEQMNWT